MTRLPVVDMLVEAQEAAGLSNGAIARAAAVQPSSVTRYKSGAAEPSLHVAAAWARACGAELTVSRPVVAAVQVLVNVAEELTRDELALLRAVAEALRSTRQDPTRRAVVLAAAGLAAGQVEQPATLPRRA